MTHLWLKMPTTACRYVSYGTVGWYWWVVEAAHGASQSMKRVCWENTVENNELVVSCLKTKQNHHLACDNISHTVSCC